MQKTEEIQGSVKKLIGQTFCGVTIDDSKKLRNFLTTAEQIDNSTAQFAMKLHLIKDVIKSSFKNAVSASKDPRNSKKTKKNITI